MKGKTVVATGATSGVGEAGRARAGAHGRADRVRGARRKARRGDARQARKRRAAARPRRASRRSLQHGRDASRRAPDRRERAARRRSRQQRRRHVRRPAGDGGGSRADLRPQSHGLFPADRGARASGSPPRRPRASSRPPRRRIRAPSSTFPTCRARRATAAGAPTAARSSPTSCSRARLARRLAGAGVTANCFHPGFVASRFGSESGGWTSRLIPLRADVRDHARRRAPTRSSISPRRPRSRT